MFDKKDLQHMDIDSYLDAHQNKKLVRFITCGSVDDGKSTLIGRLLYDSKLIYHDQLELLKKETKAKNTKVSSEDFDLSLLVDGLQAEREQGITIDVAHRYFSTQKCKFIIADTPGHEQYTRNMATGASNVDVAVILIDAKKGISTQTKRHSYIVHLLGIKKIIVAINKMDLIQYSQESFEEIKKAYLDFFYNIHQTEIIFIPISATIGDNVVHSSTKTPWYEGKSFLTTLEDLETIEDKSRLPFRFPVQYVLRPNMNFRGYCGTIASGKINAGDEVTILPSNKKAKIKHITLSDQNFKSASAGQSVTITLDQELDVSRGDLISEVKNLPFISDSFTATIVWLTEAPMILQNRIGIKTASIKTSAYIEKINFKIDVNNHQKVKDKHVGINEIAQCQITATTPLVFDPYDKNQATGSFILFDRINNNTIAAGMITNPIETNGLNWYDHQVSIPERVKLKGHRPAVIYITGKKGAGKSTIANSLEQKLNILGVHTYMVDNENIKSGLNKDLENSLEDRLEKTRRIAEITKLLHDAGLIVISSFISPISEAKDIIREVINENEFFEIFIDTPEEVVNERKKSSENEYTLARKKILEKFPNAAKRFVTPSAPDVHIKSDEESVEESVEKIIKALKKRKII